MSKKDDLRKENIENEVNDSEVTTDSEEVISEESEIDKLLKEIEELKKANEDLLDKSQRSLAEFDNFRKRTMKEKGQMFDDGVRDAIDKILPVVDNFERAVSTFENKEDNIFKGFEMILRQFITTLDDLGVKTIESVGKKFNTDYHFAVAHVEDENYSENEVVEEMQKGYIYKDKVIRCSMVKVAN